MAVPPGGCDLQEVETLFLQMVAPGKGLKLLPRKTSRRSLEALEGLSALLEKANRGDLPLHPPGAAAVLLVTSVEAVGDFLENSPEVLRLAALPAAAPVVAVSKCQYKALDDGWLATLLTSMEMLLQMN